MNESIVRADLDAALLRLEVCSSYSGLSLVEKTLGLGEKEHSFSRDFISELKEELELAAKFRENKLTASHTAEKNFHEFRAEIEELSVLLSDEELKQESITKEVQKATQHFSERYQMFSQER